MIYIKKNQLKDCQMSFETTVFSINIEILFIIYYVNLKLIIIYNIIFSFNIISHKIFNSL